MKTDGVSLIEVLISLFVLALGLLGMASLQTNAMKFGYESYLRSIATSQISDMSDRLRANPVGVSKGAYDSLSGIPNSVPSCSVCSNEEMAKIDLHEWNTNNATFLPSGQGTVQRNNNSFIITIMWDQDKTGAQGTQCSEDTNIDLTCLRVSINI